MGHRSAQQVTNRLDGLIKKIYEIQGPCMHGEKPADVILVRLRYCCSPSICGHNLDMSSDRSSDTLGASTRVVAPFP
jgi:hypothetical protein